MSSTHELEVVLVGTETGQGYGVEWMKKITPRLGFVLGPAALALVLALDTSHLGQDLARHFAFSFFFFSFFTLPRWS